MQEENIDYKKACEEAIDSMDKEFLRGVEALYHYLQDKIIGNTQDDAISIEVLKFLKPLRKNMEDTLVEKKGAWCYDCNLPENQHPFNSSPSYRKNHNHHTNCSLNNHTLFAQKKDLESEDSKGEKQ